MASLEFPEALADLMPHSTVVVAYCDTALAGIRLALAMQQSILRRQQQQQQQDDDVDNDSSNDDGGNEMRRTMMGRNNGDDQGERGGGGVGGDGGDGGLLRRNYAATATGAYPAAGGSNISVSSGLVGSFGSMHAGSRLQSMTSTPGGGGGGGGRSGNPTAAAAAAASSSTPMSNNNNDDLDENNGAADEPQVSDIELLTFTCWTSTGGSATTTTLSSANAPPAMVKRDDVVCAFQCVIRQEMMTFFIVQARLPTAETTHLAKSFVELFVKYQVRNVYILSAPNFKAQASNAVHVIHLPDLDLDDKNEVYKIPLNTQLKDHFLVTLLALLNLEKHALTTQCILYPGKRFTTRTEAMDRYDKRMLMMLSHYVNDVLDTLMIPSVLEEVSDAFLQSRPDLIAYDLAEEVQSAMYI